MSDPTPSSRKPTEHNLPSVTLSWLFPSPARASPGNAPQGRQEGRARAVPSPLLTHRSPVNPSPLQRVNKSFITCHTRAKCGLSHVSLLCAPLGTDVVIKRCLSEIVSQAEHAKHWEQHPNGGDVLLINNFNPRSCCVFHGQGNTRSSIKALGPWASHILLPQAAPAFTREPVRLSQVLSGMGVWIWEVTPGPSDHALLPGVMG